MLVRETKNYVLFTFMARLLVKLKLTYKIKTVVDKLTHTVWVSFSLSTLDIEDGRTK